MKLQALVARRAALQEIVLRLDGAGRSDRADRWMPALCRVQTAIERLQLAGAPTAATEAA